jgi:hypothetical protein
LTRGSDESSAIFKAVWFSKQKRFSKQCDFQSSVVFKAKAIFKAVRFGFVQAGTRIRATRGVKTMILGRWELQTM